MTPSELTLSVVAVSKKIGKKIDNSQKKKHSPVSLEKDWKNVLTQNYKSSSTLSNGSRTE